MRQGKAQGGTRPEGSKEGGQPVAIVSGLGAGSSKQGGANFGEWGRDDATQGAASVELVSKEKTFAATTKVTPKSSSSSCPTRRKMALRHHSTHAVGLLAEMGASHQHSASGHIDGETPSLTRGLFLYRHCGALVGGGHRCLQMLASAPGLF